ncbi:MAG: B12-binding domain-containing radical SAM protein [Phycisphaerae bacterium]|nr:B12-binding domain-containing radical SAM protein [Phycisphaerae bacterium]
MRIALVSPVARNCEGYHTTGSRIPQLGLQVLARLVPKDHEVEIIDEVFGTGQTEHLLATRGYDLVGMTAYTSGATRAYELAETCRDRGIPCIMGGPHAWACPDEAARYFDSVAIGECDEIWPEIIADAVAGKLQQRYEGKLAELEEGYGAAYQGLHPINGRYDIGCIQTARGCPVGCDFCSVTLFNGRKIRRRPVADIVEEWNSTDRKFLFVVDDNFYGVSRTHAEEAKEVLRGIAKHGTKRLWFSQTTINMGADPEGLRLAYKAGCRAMLVGFESFNPETLKNWRKPLNIKLHGDYQKLVDGFHRAGIAVFGCFVIGADEDTEDTVAQTALRAVQLGVDIIQITNLTPLPGTKLYERWLAEGRIIATDYPTDWERYTFTETVYAPKRMTAQRLDETIYELRKAAAEEPWVWKRTVKTFLRTRSISTALFVHGTNRGWARLARGFLKRDVRRFAHVRTEAQRARTLRQGFAFRCGKQPAAP